MTMNSAQSFHSCGHKLDAIVKERDTEYHDTHKYNGDLSLRRSRSRVKALEYGVTPREQRGPCVPIISSGGDVPQTPIVRREHTPARD